MALPNFFPAKLSEGYAEVKLRWHGQQQCSAALQAAYAGLKPSARAEISLSQLPDPTLDFSQYPLITLARAVVKAYENNFFEGGVLFQEGACFSHGNARGALQGKSIDAGADGGKSQRAQTILHRERQ